MIVASRTRAGVVPPAVDDPRAEAVGMGPTMSGTAEEVAPMSLASPEYTDVIWKLPTARGAYWMVAVPFEARGEEPNKAAPLA
jgi:hypothetical protein